MLTSSSQISLGEQFPSGQMVTLSAGFWIALTRCIGLWRLSLVNENQCASLGSQINIHESCLNTGDIDGKCASDAKCKHCTTNYPSGGISPLVHAKTIGTGLADSAFDALPPGFWLGVWMTMLKKSLMLAWVVSSLTGVPKLTAKPNTQILTCMRPPMGGSSI